MRCIRRFLISVGAALDEAGFGEFAIDGTPLSRARGAVSREHAHAFNAGGTFSSLDWTGQEVDNAPYTIVDDQTLTIDNPDFGLVTSDTASQASQRFGLLLGE